VAQLPLLDAHALIRSDDPARYPFQPLGPPLEPREREQGVTDTQLLAALDASHIERAVLVQRARLYAYDNRYVGDAAHAHPTRLQFVCQVDAADRDCVQQARDWIARGAVGVRFMEPTKGSDLAWLDGAGARAVWQVTCDEGVPISVHFFPWNRAAGLAILARRLQEMSPRALVLDSLAGTAVESGPPDYGVDDALRAVLGFRETHLKLTAMTLARLATAKLPAEALVTRLAAEVGAARLLWGSDVLGPGQIYGSVVAQIVQATAALSDRERAQVLHGTAAALFPLR
jgi:L-fuconolactonase